MAPWEAPAWSPAAPNAADAHRARRSPSAFGGAPIPGRAYLSGDPDLLTIHRSYAGSVPRGIVVLHDWCVDDDPQAAAAQLESAARSCGASVATSDGGELPRMLLHGGNWGVDGEGVERLYRHALP